MFNILEMTSSSSSPTPSVDLDTIDTSLSDITVLENVTSSRSSRNLEDSVQPFPDLIPRNWLTKSKTNHKDLERKGNEKKQLESIILLSMLGLCAALQGCTALCCMATP